LFYCFYFSKASSRPLKVNRNPFRNIFGGQC